MAMMRWEPFRELTRIQDEFNRVFDDRLFRWRKNEGEELGSAFFPPVDVFEDAAQLTITAELPGIEPNAVDVHVENGVLTLKGERKLEKEDRKDNYLRIERTYGSFARTFTLPPTVNSEQVKAEFKNGLLKVVLPKREETKPRSIKVKVD
jgi:HSP20 family protein